ncbi:MAG TPA: allantoinase AllB, partial [Jiangellales bacterium]|nr:allantoinase AllB [Jiangellales bacterium]
DDEVLLPGFVDTHVHCDDPGRSEWEGFRAATAAAAAGGVTTVVDMPLNSLPPTLDVAALEAKRDAARGRCVVDVGFWGGAVPGNPGGLRPLLDAGALGVKGFTCDSGVPEFPPLAPDDLRRVAAELAAADGLLLVHAEDPLLLASAPPARGPSYTRFLGSRPAAAEDRAAAAVLDTARTTGVRVHLVHVSSAGVLPLLAAARADGVRVTAETCPHYLVLDAATIPDGATEAKCCPPVREAVHREALWRGLAEGLLDLVVSDHSPCPPELKAGGFDAAWGGIAGVQLGLPLLWTEARRRGHGLEHVARWAAYAPALLAGLPGKGRVAEGADADLVVLAPDEPVTVRAEMLRSRHRLTPYEGRRLTGAVRRTWLRGTEVDGVPRGRLLVRGGS